MILGIMQAIQNLDRWRTEIENKSVTLCLQSTSRKHGTSQLKDPNKYFVSLSALTLDCKMIRTSSIIGESWKRKQFGY